MDPILPRITTQEATLLLQLPCEILKIIFSQVVENSNFYTSTNSILLTCKISQQLLEKNPCVRFLQSLFQLKRGFLSKKNLTPFFSSIEQKECFNSKELYIFNCCIPHLFRKSFKTVVYSQSGLFQHKSMFLDLLHRYGWRLKKALESRDQDIQKIAHEQSKCFNTLKSIPYLQKPVSKENRTLFRKHFIEIYKGLFLGPIVDTITAFLTPNCNDQDFLLAAIQKKESILEYADENLKKNRKFVLAALCKNGKALQYADESLKKDRDVVLAAVCQNGLAFEHADESLKKDRDIVLAAVCQNGLALEYADESLKEDRGVVLAAVCQNGLALEYADESLKEDRGVVLAAVCQNGLAFEHADESLKKDRDIVLTAVRQDGYALEYADENLKKDRGVVLAAVRQDGPALKHADESLKKDRDVVLAAVCQNGLALGYVDESLKKDRGVVLAAFAKMVLLLNMQIKA